MMDKTSQTTASTGQNTGACVVHIPARGGSTRLPGKILRKLNGAPLLAYTVLLAVRLPQVDHVVVNTDSVEIAEVARHCGAEVPFLRPKSISGRKASLEDAEKLLLQQLEQQGVNVGRIVTLLPTSPFRNLGRVSEMVRDLGIYKRVASAHYVRVQWDDYLVSINGETELLSRRMNRKIPEGCYIKTNGQFFGRHRELELKRTSLYYMINDPVELVDIDTEQDLKTAEAILPNNVYDFGFSI